MNAGVCTDICIVISTLGFLFMFYLFVLSVFDPERLHIVKHANAEEDQENYTKAWISAIVASLIYLIIGAGLFYKRYGSKEEIDKLLDKIKSLTEKPYSETDYEFNGTNGRDMPANFELAEVRRR